jgi:hypothetical protein
MEIYQLERVSMCISHAEREPGLQRSSASESIERVSVAVAQAGTVPGV